ncbi:acyltransferase family protein [uncultured Mediterranea sp.]|uniref:acyltransferase n=1 Tax=uncultured Mediterranea sp. TaxID=1926662 RepID=UPI0027D948F3|nr:acyltransferase family protein [uncultured Mediterranea sp.]
MKEPLIEKDDKRIVWLDFVKFVAIFMMIAVHCTDNVTPAERSEPWYNLWGSFYGSFMRPAIPLFVMVTGALLLPVRQSISAFYTKRLTRLVVPFIIWSVVYNLFPWLTGVLGLPPTVINDFFAWAEPDQSFSGALHNILMIPFNFSMLAVQMWYVYLLIGLYLYMPIFSAWVRQASIKEQRVFLALWFISLFIPYLREYLTKDLWGTCSWNEFGLLYYFAGFNGYLLLGYYIMNNNMNVTWGRLAVFGIPSFVIGYCVTFWGFKSITAVPGQPVELVELFFTYCSPNVLMMTLPIFLAIRKFRFDSLAIRRFSTSISICTFGIWMSHYLFLGPCYMLVESLPLHTMVKMMVCTVLLLSVTWGFVYVVRKSGKVGRWIMG